MKKNLKNIGFYLLLFVILIVVLAFMGTQPVIEEHTMSDLLRSIEKQEVTGLILEEDRAIASLTNGDQMIVEIPSADLFLIFATAEIKELVAQNPDFVFSTPTPAVAPWWLSMIPSVVFILLMIVLYFFIFRQMQGGGGGGGKVMNFGKSRAKTLSNMGKKVTFEDVAGADEEKAELEEIVDFLKVPDKYTKLGARIPKGVLLVGPPGTGKTLLAKAVAGEAGVPFFSISGSDFVEMFVGVGAARVRDLFEEAKKSTPSVIFIDEIDAVGRHRGAGLGGGHDEREQTLNQLLVEMDGFGVNEGIIIIAATNRPDILDPALLRPGRFDRQVVVNTPDVGGREAILKVHARNKTLAADVDLKVIAKTTSGFTGADLENLLNEAALLAAGKGKPAIDNDDIQHALTKVVIGVEKKSLKINEKEKRITAIHEAGHAIISRLLPDQDPVHEVSIIPRGMAGGYTMYLPDEDRYHITKTYMLDSIKGLLGGRAAEQIMLGDITTGASNDIERASELARKMVAKYGMSEKVGPITFGSSNNEVFIGKDWTQTKSFSEELASIIDKEVSEIIDSCYKNAIKLLTENKDKLIRVADALVEFEKIDGETFEKLFTFDSSAQREDSPVSDNTENNLTD